MTGIKVNRHAFGYTLSFLHFQWLCFFFMAQRSMQLNARTLSMNQFSNILRIKVTLNCEFHSQWTAQSAAIHGDLCTNILQPRTLSKQINKKDIQTAERLWCNPILIQNKALASNIILFFHHIVPKEKKIKEKTRTHDSLLIAHNICQLYNKWGYSKIQPNMFFEHRNVSRILRSKLFI